MKKKIHIDGIIISLYDLPLISNNNVIGDFENSYYKIVTDIDTCCITDIIQLIKLY